MKSDSSRIDGPSAMGVRRANRWLPVMNVAAVMLMTMGTCLGDEPGDAPPKPAKEPTVQTFRLVNVTIPPDSPHRQSPSIKECYLYVYVLKDGKHLGNSSTYSTKGWSVDFPDEKQNRWEIEQGTKARYGIQLWSNEGWWDTQILSITSIRGEDFHDVIREMQQKGVSKERCTTFTFEAIPDPAPTAGPSEVPAKEKGE